MELGIVTIEITLEEIQRIIEATDLGPGGFGGLVSGNGTYLYHPNKDLVIKGKTILDIAREKNDRDRLLISERITRGEGGIIDHISLTTGKESWLVYEPVERTGWSVQNTFLKDDIAIDRNKLRQQLIRITLFAIIFLALFIFQLLSSFRTTNRKMWGLAFTVSLLFVVGICCVWLIATAYETLENNDDNPINSHAALIRFKNMWAKTGSNGSAQTPLFIPTGIYLESLSLSDGKNLTASGYVWQKYYSHIPRELPREFTISGADSLDKTKVYYRKTGGMELIRWRFRAQWPARLDYTKYPLTTAKIDLKLLHNAYHKNVVLIPDLEAYNIVNPTSLPGLDKQLSLTGWSLRKSFFELRNEDFKTDLGNNKDGATGSMHNLYFNVVIHKNFLDSFISNLAPLKLVAFLLFCVLIITTHDEALLEKLDAGTGTVLAFCAGLFFVVVFSHIDVREKIAAGKLFYLEYFFFIMYLNLLFVSLNAILFNLGKVSFIQYRDNLIPKLAYWPVQTGFIALVTFLTFY